MGRLFRNTSVSSYPSPTATVRKTDILLTAVLKTFFFFKSFEDDLGFIPVSAQGGVTGKVEETSWQPAATDSCQEVMLPKN